MVASSVADPAATPADRSGNAFDAALALTVAYDGSGFSGFARQPGQATIQGELEQALRVLLRREVETTGAGRTDAGVHALAQVVSFGITRQELEGRSLEKLRSSLNALTPDGLVVRMIEEKPAGFSARFDAKDREYRYRLISGRIEPLFLARFAWWLPSERPLDITAMKAAGALLVGEHDFASFCIAKSAEGKTTMREVKQLQLFGAEHLGEDCVVIRGVGNAFLHSMVRVIAGSLVEVGLRNRSPEWLFEVLEARDRRSAGQTAPAHGLTFWQVRY
jgi:tRNA pseudouridine38-40 synthase